MNSSNDSREYPDLALNYKKFEDTYRGDSAAITLKQRNYLEFFKGCKRVLDIGCGRGEFIELLKENAIGALGIDMSDSMIEECRKKGLEVVQNDVLSFFKENQNQKIDGIFCAQVVEHLHMKDIVEMVKLAYEALEKDRFIVIETINILTLLPFTGAVYLDPSHVKPVHPGTLEFIFESVGFKDIEFIFSSEVPATHKLAKIEEKNRNDQIYNANITKLNSILFGPQDYAIIGKK